MPILLRPDTGNLWARPNLVLTQSYRVPFRVDIRVQPTHLYTVAPNEIARSEESDSLIVGRSDELTILQKPKNQLITGLRHM